MHMALCTAHSEDTLALLFLGPFIIQRCGWEDKLNTCLPPSWGLEANGLMPATMYFVAYLKSVGVGVRRRWRWQRAGVARVLVERMGEGKEHTWSLTDIEKPSGTDIEEPSGTGAPESELEGTKTFRMLIVRMCCGISPASTETMCFSSSASAPFHRAQDDWPNARKMPVLVTPWPTAPGTLRPLMTNAAAQSRSLCSQPSVPL